MTFEQQVKQVMAQNWVPCSMPDGVFQMIGEVERNSQLGFPTPDRVSQLMSAMSAQGFYSRVLRTGAGRPLHCKQNVAQYIQQHGGEAVNGITLWEDPTTGAFTKEAHTVVMTPNGILDVTSTFGGDPLIFFVSKS